MKGLASKGLQGESKLSKGYDPNGSPSSCWRIAYNKEINSEKRSNALSAGVPTDMVGCLVVGKFGDENGALVASSSVE